MSAISHKRTLGHTNQPPNQRRYDDAFHGAPPSFILRDVHTDIENGFELEIEVAC